MTGRIKIVLLVTGTLVAAATAFPPYQFDLINTATGDAYKSSPGGHYFIASPPRTPPADGTNRYGSPSYQGSNINDWTSGIDYGRMFIVVGLISVLGVVGGLAVTMIPARHIKRNPDRKDKGPTPRQPDEVGVAAALVQTPALMEAREVNSPTNTKQKSERSSLPYGLLRYGAASITALAGLMGGALAVEVAVSSGFRLPMATPGILAVVGFLLVTKLFLPAYRKDSSTTNHDHSTTSNSGQAVNAGQIDDLLIEADVHYNSNQFARAKEIYRLIIASGIQSNDVDYAKGRLQDIQEIESR